MLEPEKLDYFKWQIPDGACVRLTLLQEDDLALLHKWKSQVDISYITSKAIQHISLEERQRRFKGKIPSIFAIRRMIDNQFIFQEQLCRNCVVLERLIFDIDVDDAWLLR